MFVYEKKLQYPVRIRKPDQRMASVIISQYGGPDGELGASLRYLSQRYAMPYDELKGLLTDVGTEELGHLEMVGSMIHQLTHDLTDCQIQDSAFAPYFTDHGLGVYPQFASGQPYHAGAMAVKGDPITDLHEDLAADAAIMQVQPCPQALENTHFLLVLAFSCYNHVKTTWKKERWTSCFTTHLSRIPKHGIDLILHV